MNAKAQENRKGRNSYTPTKCIIGFDQSYTRTGIAIVSNGKLRKITSEPFKGVTNKSEKRIRLADDVAKVINKCLEKYRPEEISIIVERIRTFTQGYDIRPNFLISQGALIASIVIGTIQLGATVDYEILMTSKYN